MSPTATVPSAAPDRPGMSFYAPEVRVSKLAASLQASAEPGTVLPRGVLGDLMHAEVTRVNSGLSQYTLTFNNAFLSTAQDRQQRFDDLGAGNPRELLGAKDLPAWPRFKYNDFAQLCFGDRLRVDMRYMPEPGSTSLDPDATGAGWTPMVAGPITDIRFSFASGQGAQITVSGEDDLSRLKDKHRGRVPMNRRAEVSIVRQVLEKVQYPLKIANPLVKYPDFVLDDTQGIDEALADGQSPFDLIQKLADRLDFEVFLDFGQPSASVPVPPLEFHFEPYRGRAKPNEHLRSAYRIDRERNLLEFSPSIKVVDQYSRVLVKGRHRDPLLATEVKGEASHQILSDELHIDTSVDGPLTSGPELREKWFGGQPNWTSLPNQTNLDEVRADWAARTAIRKRARQLFAIEVQCVGGPRIRPGNHVEIRGMRPPFDGFYYVTRTVHTLGTDGYRTRITATRPGMPAPPYVLPKENAS